MIKNPMFDDIFSLKTRIRSSPKRRVQNSTLLDLVTSEPIAPSLATPAGQALDSAPADDGTQNYFILSLVSMGLVLAAHIFYPPLALLSIPTQICTMYPLVKRGYQELIQERRVTMSVIDMIVVPGVLLSGYLFANAFAILLLYSSKLILKRTENHSKQSIANIFGELPATAWVLIDQQEVEVPVAQLQVGDRVVVNAGNMIPVDGAIVTGLGSVDQRMLTGEAQPLEKEIGDEVFAATILLSGTISIQVEHTGAETVAAKIGDILLRTADFQAHVQSRGEAMSDQSAPFTLALGTVTLPLLGVQSALAVLYASLGYNLRIIAPLSMLNFLRIATHSGILIKDARSLDALKEVDTVIFDKTGTLTVEQPQISRLYVWHDLDEDQLLAYAAAAETKQTHPIAKAILHAAHAKQLVIPPIENARYEIGYGITVQLADTTVAIGSHRFMAAEGIAIPPEADEIQNECQFKGHSLVMVALDNRFSGAIELEPTVRPEVGEIVEQLRDLGLTLYIISGDQEEPTRKLAQTLKIDHYFANTLPEQKARHIEELQREGKTVCFIGDGINDAIALQQANVSVSLRGASTIATDTAQAILMNGNLNQLAKLFRIAYAFDDNMKVALWTTLVPGIICIGGVYLLHLGIMSAISLYNIGLVAGVGNAMLPLLKNARNRAA